MSSAIAVRKGALAHLFVPKDSGPIRTMAVTGMAALAAHGWQTGISFSRRLTVEAFNPMTSPNVGQFRGPVWGDFLLATLFSGAVGLMTKSVLPGLGAEAIAVYHLVSRLQKISEVESRGTV